MIKWALQERGWGFREARKTTEHRHDSGYWIHDMGGRNVIQRREQRVQTDRGDRD
jgi:hypothetical protein